MDSSRVDVVIIGGGFFGMYIAEYFSRKGKRVLLCEKEADFMQRASYANQARIHNGYHYPRSVLTALRSRVSFPRFCQEFAECVDDSFEKYYMLGKILGNVSAGQFEKFCHRIGAPCEPAPHAITRLVNPNLIEAVFSTEECAFDAVKLKEVMMQRIVDARVGVRLSTIVDVVQPSRGGLTVTLCQSGNTEETETIHTTHAFNCTYSMLNLVLTRSGVPRIPLKHEMAEICLVEVPDVLKNKGITVMCGPFFSVMPFPPRGLHSFSHVRYTPHYQWYDDSDHPYFNAHEHFAGVEKRTEWRKMVLDASRYIPVLSECRYRDSIWEVKTVLPRSEVDDSRPILLKTNYGMTGLHCLMGGKIDNVYDAIEVIETLGLDS